MSFVLRNHGQVFGLKELHYFGDFWDPRNPAQCFSDRQMTTAVAWIFARQAQHILLAKPTSQDMERARVLLDSLSAEDRGPASLFAATVSQLSAEAGKPIPCEQTPRNIFYAEELLRVYPEARVVHMLRDPRAVMASQRLRWQRRRLVNNKTFFPHTQSLRMWVNYHPYTAARLWASASRAAQRLSDHPRFVPIRFEDLLESPEQTIRFMCDRLGIDFEPAMLEVPQINSSHQSSVGGARRGLHKDAIDAWRTTLPPGEAAIAERICGKLMAYYGYATDTRQPSCGIGELRYKLTYLLHAAGVLAVNPRRAWIQMRAVFKGGRTT